MRAMMARDFSALLNRLLSLLALYTTGLPKGKNFSFISLPTFSLFKVTSIGFHGNVVSVWERLVEEHRSTGDLLVDLGSDQTSCHNPFNGGYFPVQLGHDEAQRVRDRP